MHDCDCDSPGSHATPPALGAVTWLRVRVCVAPPHDTAHVLHAAQSDRTQSIGQAWSLHGLLAVRSPHTSPPCSSSVTMDRPRVCCPLPHDAEHVLQAPQADVSQSTAQLCVLQARVSVMWPHGIPPWACVGSAERTRDMVPLEQDVEHASHAPQLPMAQSTEHGWLLQLRASEACGHELPPN